MTSQYGIPGQRQGRTVQPRDIVASFSPPPRYVRGVLDATYCYDGDNTSYESELRAGIPLAQITATKLWAPCKRSRANQSLGVGTSLVLDSARFFQSGDTITVRGKQAIVKVLDNDDAATDGTDLYLHVDELGESPFGHFESVTAGDADTSFTTLDGAVVKVEDDDAAATGGVAVYIDENATNPDERFLAAVPTGKDAFVLASDGRAIRIKYHASPGTPGVAVHIDDDGATASERLMFVSPTDADAYALTDDEVGTAANDSYIDRTTTNAISAITYSTNTLTITSAVIADNDEVFVDVAAQAGLEICRGFLNMFVDLIDHDTPSTARDRMVGKILTQGMVDASMVYGDLEAIRAAEAWETTQRIPAIEFDDYAGQA